MPHYLASNGEHRELSEFEADLGYEFEDTGLLRRALTHRSFANEHPEISDDNQRLEFLGDAVLGVIVAEALFRHHREAPEGTLSRRLSELVCEEALVERAGELQLGDYLLLGRGEEMTGGRDKEALLADAYEAVLGAVYLDAGHDRVRELILAHFGDSVERLTDGEDRAESRSPRDYKSLLQRQVQSRRPIRPSYEIVETSGPPHDREFVAEALVESTVVGRGEGASKQDAEQAAAARAVADFEDGDGPLMRVLEEATGEEETGRDTNEK